MKAQAFEIHPSPGADFCPRGARVLALELQGAERLDERARGAVALPSFDGADRFVFLYDDPGSLWSPPAGGERCAAWRLVRRPCQILDAVIEADPEAEALGSWSDDGQPELPGRFAVLAATWRALLTREPILVETRIGGQETGRAAQVLVRAPVLRDGRTLAGEVERRAGSVRGGLSLSWITRIRAAVEAPCRGK